MGVHIGNSKLVVTTEPNTFHFDLLKHVDINLKHEIDIIIKHNDLLAENLSEKDINQ